MVRMETGNMVLLIILSGMKAYHRDNTNWYTPGFQYQQ